MDVEDGAELTEMGARYWLSMDGWTAWETALLLCNINPLLLEEWRNISGRKLEVSIPLELLPKRDLIVRAFEAKVLTTPAAPSAVIAWAMGKGLRLPALLDGMVCEGGKWVKLGTPQAPEVPQELIATKVPATVAALPKQRAQEARILELLKAQGYEPLALAQRKPGKPGPKAEIRTLALNEPAMFTPKTFDTAWQRLRDANEIAGVE